MACICGTCRLFYLGGSVKRKKGRRNKKQSEKFVVFEGWLRRLGEKGEREVRVRGLGKRFLSVSFALSLNLFCRISLSVAFSACIILNHVFIIL